MGKDTKIGEVIRKASAENGRGRLYREVFELLEIAPNSLTNKDLNELIAEKVFGWKQVPGTPNWRMEKVGEGTVVGELPRFSTQVESARLIFEVFQLKFGQSAYVKFIQRIPSYIASDRKSGANRTVETFSGVDPRQVCTAALFALASR